jgi:hypothetical protein
MITKIVSSNHPDRKRKPYGPRAHLRQIWVAA